MGNIAKRVRRRVGYGTLDIPAGFEWACNAPGATGDCQPATRMLVKDGAVVASCCDACASRLRAVYLG